MMWNKVEIQKGPRTQPLLHVIRTLWNWESLFFVLLNPNLRWQMQTRGRNVYAEHVHPLDRCRSALCIVWVFLGFFDVDSIFKGAIYSCYCEFTVSPCNADLGLI